MVLSKVIVSPVKVSEFLLKYNEKDRKIIIMRREEKKIYELANVHFFPKAQYSQRLQAAFIMDNLRCLLSSVLKISL